jgi:hydroxymethylpyrimidine pyrophosphatase-like HAD family hydrolase
LNFSSKNEIHESIAKYWGSKRPDLDFVCSREYARDGHCYRIRHKKTGLNYQFYLDDMIFYNNPDHYALEMERMMQRAVHELDKHVDDKLCINKTMEFNKLTEVEEKVAEKKLHERNRKDYDKVDGFGDF